MNEVMILLLALLLLLSPLVLSIVALVQAARAAGEIRELRARLERSRGEPVRPPAPVPEPSRPSAPASPAAPAAPPPSPRVIPPAPRPQSAPQPAAPPVAGRAWEDVLGGRAAAFVGIAAVVLGVVFFVGYAIQHNWIGPGLRVILGLLAGVALVALGHAAETRGRLTLLARALTGGGAALFYFTLFAAYHIYHLIGPALAAAGLTASAAAAFGLAAVYDSQAVAVMSLLGAFLTPLLIGGDFGHGLFPLVFIAAVNVPVILLGVKRRWQACYNLAFVLTALMAAHWLARGLGSAGGGAWRVGLAMTVVYFAEFVALGLLKLSGESAAPRRPLDTARLLVNSLALLGALDWILHAAHRQGWIGTAFLAAAAVHIGLARLAWRWWPHFTDEILACLAGALTFAALALPAQLDGVWVSLGWALEGVILAWFALRVASRPLLAGALGLGMLALLKSSFYDAGLYQHAPRLFLNGRFAVGLLSAALLGAQGWMHERLAPPDLFRGGAWTALLGVSAVLGLLLAVTVDAFQVWSAAEPWAWLLTTLALAAAGLLTVAWGRRGPSTWADALGTLLLVVAPIKLMLVDLSCGWSHYVRHTEPFANPVWLMQLLALAAVLAGVACLRRDPAAANLRVCSWGRLILGSSLIGMLAVVTLEMGRARWPWTPSFITLGWALAALAMGVVGLTRRAAWLRYLALAVFGAAVGKVFLVDLADLRGMPRVAAFIGVGLLLLLLSLAYQKVAPRFRDAGRSPGAAP